MSKLGRLSNQIMDCEKVNRHMSTRCTNLLRANIEQKNPFSSSSNDFLPSRAESTNVFNDKKRYLIQMNFGFILYFKRSEKLRHNY